ncbi:hypothetical protein YQE_06377, partial [Dendroctonus ponderosae]
MKGESDDGLGDEFAEDQSKFIPREVVIEELPDSEDSEGSRAAQTCLVMGNLRPGRRRTTRGGASDRDPKSRPKAGQVPEDGQPDGHHCGALLSEGPRFDHRDQPAGHSGNRRLGAADQPAGDQGSEMQAGRSERAHRTVSERGHPQIHRQLGRHGAFGAQPHRTGARPADSGRRNHLQCGASEEGAQTHPCRGISKLVDFLDCSELHLATPKDKLDEDATASVAMVSAAARALWSVSRSRKNIQVMMKSGAVPLLARLLRSVHMDVVIPTIGTISQCATDPCYQLAIQTEGMVSDIVRHLSADESPALRRFCAETIYKCCAKAATRDMVRQSGGLDPLVNMAKNPATKLDKALLAAVTGAIWKTAVSPENVERFDQLKTVEVLVKLLENVEEDERVLSNVVGALGECLKFEHNRNSLRRANGIPHLVNLLNYTYPPLLENVPMVLRECAEDDESMREIERLDGVRLIWSLLKNDSPQVQANAAWSLVPCIRHATDSGEMVRCFVGGLELIVNLLKSPDSHVLACVCAAISEVAKDIENLAVITDHGVVPMLVNLVETDDVELRQHLASAIAYCCAWGSNCKEFGRYASNRLAPSSGYRIGRHHAIGSVHGGRGTGRASNHRPRPLPPVEEPVQLHHNARERRGSVSAQGGLCHRLEAAGGGRRLFGQHPQAGARGGDGAFGAEPARHGRRRRLIV